MTGLTYQRVLIGYLLTVVLAQIAFAALPEIDLAVARLFVSRTEGFGWAGGPAATLNLALRRIGEAVSLLLVGAWLLGWLTGRLQRDDLRLLAYPALCVILACGGIVNLVLKAHVGRARPDSLVEFGGEARFSPAWQIVDECSRNCSFASGEVAMAASLAIPAIVVLWPHLATRRARLLAILLGAAYVSVTALLRIGLGRHFLSDAVFSVLFAAAFALILYPALHIDEARLRFGGQAILVRYRRAVAERRERRSAPRREAP